MDGPFLFRLPTTVAWAPGTVTHHTLFAAELLGISGSKRNDRSFSA